MPAAIGRRLTADAAQAENVCFRRQRMKAPPISPKPVRASMAVLGSGTTFAFASAVKFNMGQAAQPPLLQPKPSSKLWPAGTPIRVPKAVNTMRAPFAPLGMTLQLKRLLLQVIFEAATPVSVKVRLVQATPDMFVKCCVGCGAVESATVKVSAVSAVQEYELPQPVALFTFRGVLVAAALATTAERFISVAWSNAGEKFTELARASAGMIATASATTRICTAFLWVDETLGAIEEQSRIDFQVIFFPHANGAPLRVAISDASPRRALPKALGQRFPELAEASHASEFRDREYCGHVSR